MNAIIPAQPQPVVTPQQFGLVPSTMSEAMQLANMMATAKLVPAALQKSPADCLMVIQQAVRWQMDVFAVAQECSVIQGKLMHSGKLVMAVINARGNLAERLAFTYEGEGDERTITVSGRLFGETEPRTVKVKIKDARTANRVWQTQPDQQLAYHGSRVWARRHAPELMLGVYSPEEFDEPQPLRASAKTPPAPKANVMLPPHDPETGEIVDQPTEIESSPASTGKATDGAPASQALAPMAGEPPLRTEAGAPALSLEDEARAEARKGEEAFKSFYKKCIPASRSRLSTISEELRNLMNESKPT